MKAALRSRQPSPAKTVRVGMTTAEIEAVMGQAPDPKAD
jgi:hypothetical protein